MTDVESKPEHESITMINLLQNINILDWHVQFSPVVYNIFILRA